MDVSQPSSSGPDATREPAPGADPRSDKAPDDGTRVARIGRFGPVLAVAIGVLLAVLVGSIGSAHAAWARFASLFYLSGSPAPPSQAKNSLQLDHLKPQKQAEALLEQAVVHSDGAVEQISSRVDRWQGKVQWNSQIATLTTAALNSSDMRVRESGIEVELAAYGLAKNSASLDYVLQTAESPDHAQQIWGLWALGLLGNRGVETDHVVQVLTTHLKDSNDDSRRWAVEGLALVGTTNTLDPLLKTMHDDPSPSVREAAACSLAESGMFTPEDRLSVVPRLIGYTDDPALDAQTHAWAFQALGDITKQHLPNDAAAWRSWHDSTKSD